MILTSTEELRLYFPAHAIDHIEPYAGFIDNSEHDFLLPALGQPLYEKLCEYYDQKKHELSTVEDADTDYFNRLIMKAQRCIAFDFMGSAIDVQAVSINNAGLNFSSSDDYKPADRDSRRDATAACQREAHKSLNSLLYALELWVQQAPDAEEAKHENEELFMIATLWKQSRYYYLAAQMLIPSAKTMQEYLNIYDSRERFIQMLPDLRYIQEEVLAPAIGEDFLEYLVEYALRNEIPAESDATNSESKLFTKLVHRLRKIQATFLEGRTTVLKIDKERKIQARDEGVVLLKRLTDDIRNAQPAILTALGEDNKNIFELSPLYVKPVEAPAPSEADRHQGCCDARKEFRNNTPGAAMFVTEPLL